KARENPLPQELFRATIRIGHGRRVVLDVDDEAGAPEVPAHQRTALRHQLPNEGHEGRDVHRRHTVPGRSNERKAPGRGGSGGGGRPGPRRLRTGGASDDGSSSRTSYRIVL